MLIPCKDCSQIGLDFEGRQKYYRTSFTFWDFNYAKLKLTKEEIKLLVDSSFLLVEGKKYRFVDGKYEIKQDGKWLSTKPPKMPTQAELEAQPQFCTWQESGNISQLLLPQSEREKHICTTCCGTGRMEATNIKPDLPTISRTLAFKQIADLETMLETARKQYNNNALTSGSEWK